MIFKAKKDILFVDFFDTVMFRDIHSFQLLPQWERLIKNKYGILEGINLQKIRSRASESGGAKPYRDIIYEIYSVLRQMGYCGCGEDEFYEVSYLADVSLELATQYPNWKMARYLRRQKKRGKKIYLISDYYLPTEVYAIFLERWKIADLFEKIYCSSDMGMTKWQGDLYESVLNDLDIDAERVCMIGDNWRSDVKNAREHRIKGYWYFPFFHKIKTNLSKRLDQDAYIFRKRCMQRVFKRACKHTLFNEYGAMFSFVSDKLYQTFRQDGVRRAHFLSRGGVSP